MSTWTIDVAARIYTLPEHRILSSLLLVRSTSCCTYTKHYCRYYYGIFYWLRRWRFALSGSLAEMMSFTYQQLHCRHLTMACACALATGINGTVPANMCRNCLLLIASLISCCFLLYQSLCSRHVLLLITLGCLTYNCQCFTFVLRKADVNAWWTRFAHNLHN